MSNLKAAVLALKMSNNNLLPLKAPMQLFWRTNHSEAASMALKCQKREFCAAVLALEIPKKLNIYLKFPFGLPL